MGERKSRKLHRDLSREECGSFAVSLSPACGRIHASEAKPSGNSEGEACHTAVLKWPTLGDPSNPCNPPFRAGFLIENHELTFLRGNTDDQWRSSGVVLRDLPRQIIPAVFMPSVIGDANVDFLYLWNTPPEVWCTQCDEHFRGFKTDWQTNCKRFAESKEDS